MSEDAESTENLIKRTLTGREMLGIMFELQLPARSTVKSRTVVVSAVLKGK